MVVSSVIHSTKAGEEEHVDWRRTSEVSLWRRRAGRSDGGGEKRSGMSWKMMKGIRERYG